MRCNSVRNFLLYRELDEALDDTKKILNREIVSATKLHLENIAKKGQKLVALSHI